VPDRDMPSPTEEQRESPEFEAVWQAIKTWDVNVPEYYDGYCGANGSHVKLIVDGIAEATKESNLVRELLEHYERIGVDVETDFAAANLLMMMRVFALGGHGGSSAAWCIGWFNRVVERHDGEDESGPQLREALALARSMILSGESMTPEAEATFNAALGVDA
jgi:hypothetical protein